jgi:hypothetical protein
MAYFKALSHRFLGGTVENCRNLSLCSLLAGHPVRSIIVISSAHSCLYGLTAHGKLFRVQRKQKDKNNMGKERNTRKIT